MIQEPEIKFLHQHHGETSQERTISNTVLVDKNVKVDQTISPMDMNIPGWGKPQPKQQSLKKQNSKGKEEEEEWIEGEGM